MSKKMDISDKIIQRICECGWSAYLCGGAVRDIFIDLEPQDYDIVTNALPEDLAHIFPDRKVNLVGASFLVTLVDNIGEVVDRFNGRTDLENKVVRFVGNPSDRIYEDYLRMMRAARFACLIEGELDKQTFDAIKDNKHLIKKVSPERIRMELLKSMKYNKPHIFFDVLHYTGLLEIILPEMEAMYNHTGGNYHAETLDIHAKLTGNFLSPKDP